MAKKVDRLFYTYYETQYSGIGMASTIMGFLSVALFVVVAGASVIQKGNAGDWVGAVGFTGFAMALAGVIIGLRSFRDRCRSYLFCKLGSIICGLMFAVWFLIFCRGLML